VCRGNPGCTSGPARWPAGVVPANCLAAVGLAVVVPVEVGSVAVVPVGVRSAVAGLVEVGSAEVGSAEVGLAAGDSEAAGSAEAVHPGGGETVANWLVDVGAGAGRIGLPRIAIHSTVRCPASCRPDRSAQAACGAPQWVARRHAVRVVPSERGPGVVRLGAEGSPAARSRRVDAKEAASQPG
jgi:hypothetical protein